MGKRTTVIFDPNNPRESSGHVTKTSRQLPDRPTNAIRAPNPPKRPTLNGKRAPAENWAVAMDDLEQWPYRDPDTLLAKPEPEIDDLLPLDRELPPDVIPFSEYEPWGRKSDESDTEYKYFLAYRAQGFGRELKNVATRFNVSRIHIGKMAKDHDWHTRAVAWDLERERVYTQELLSGTREMAQKHVKIAQKGLKNLSLVFDEIEHRAENDPAFVEQLRKLPPKALITLAQRSAQVIPNLMQAERLARNLPTEIVSVHHDHDIRSQSLDEIADVVAAFVSSLPRPEVLEGTVIEDDAGTAGEITDSADSEAQ